MPTKKRTVRTSKSTMEAAASSESHQDSEERRPPVTQVVEVVEDEMTPAAHESDAPVENPTGHSQHSHEHSGIEEPAVEEASSDEKRRMLVDELFQKTEKEEIPVAAEVSIHRKSSSRSLLMWAIILIVASLIVGGVLMVMSGKAPNVSTMFAKPTPTPTSSPTPTPTPDISALDKQSLKIQVLNGSGTSGEAGKMKTLLEEKGYSVEDTGNADTYDYENTQIQVKEDKKEFLPLLTQDLQESYTISSSAGALSEDVPYDVRIIVGKE